MLYVIDGTVESDKKEVRTPVKDYEVLYNELKMYKDGVLLQKPSLIVVNKMDRKYTNFKQKFERLKKIAHCPVLPISAKEGDNLEMLLETIKDIVDVEKAKTEL
jgi:GTPase involved in cell partitioning and DNA repair